VKAAASILLAGLAISASPLFSGCGSGSSDHPRSQPGEVVVYSSVDDEYVRPIAELFAKHAGIRVKLVLDTEETKSTSILNRLIAEAERPRADVFWSGDPVRAAVLKTHDLSAPYLPKQKAGLATKYSDPDNHYVSFSARIRVIIYNTNLLAGRALPASIHDLTDVRFRSRACIANPLYGTTSMHAAALFQVLGDRGGRAWFEKLNANGVKMLSSNGEVRRRVAAGDFDIGLTDSDDVNVALRDGKPINFVIPDQDSLGTLLIPNAAALVRGAPNAQNGKAFIDFLISQEVEQLLARSEAVQIPLREGLATPPLFGRDWRQLRLMAVDYAKLAAGFEELNKRFLEDWVRQQSGSSAGPVEANPHTEASRT